MGVRPVSGTLAFVCALLASASLMGCDVDFLKSADSLKVDVQKSLVAKNFSEAAGIAQRLTEKATADFEGYFLLAQAKAQVGDKNASLIALEKAIKSGLKDDEQIDKNANLDPIKSMSAYRDLMDSNFPTRKGMTGLVRSDASGGVSIREGNGKQIIRAGDVVIEVPSEK